MKLFSKKGLLFLVQIDHLSGEILGDVIDSFYCAGAKNVQVISTITKKNRPGSIILIDGTEKAASAIEAVIVEECGSSGWHRIESCHRHTEVFYLQKTIHIRLPEEELFFQAKGKQIADDRRGIRPEYDSCVKLRQELAARGKHISLRRLHLLLTNAFLQDTEEAELKI